MKKVLVTGATSGMGMSLTHQLLAQGVQVVGLGRDHAGLAGRENYTPITIDFSDAKTLEQRLKSIAAEHPDVESLIGCCGYGRFAELEQLSFSDIQSMMMVNFTSQALLVKIFLPLLKKQSGAKIILMGSEAALTGQRKGSLYCASKFALRGFAQALRAECSKANVAVTLINPGMVETPFFDALNFKPGENVSHRISSDQIADMILFVLQLDNNCVMEELNCQPMQKVIVKKT